MQASRTGSTGGENQGKLLLEQLMQGISLNPHPQPFQQEPVAQSSPPRAPNPTQKSNAEFVSPLDALSTTANKRNPVPNDPSFPQPDLAEARVKTNGDLMDQLTQSIGENPYPLQQLEPSPPTQRNVPTPPVPPTPMPAATPHRIPSLPRSYGRARPVNSPTLADSTGHQPQTRPIVHTSSSSGREKDNSSPHIHSTRGQDPGPSKLGHQGAFSALPTQTITIDVAQPFASTMASRSSVLVTAVALLKSDSVYLPGYTIGVSSWFAYAMPKGRVRIIARSDGAYTLLKLPPTFPRTTFVIDMVFSRNLLACVTSDGGLVVWELPTVIDDDVPSKLLLCVLPTLGPNAFKVVKWHPQEPNTLAVGSDREIHLLDVDEIFDRFKGEPIRQYDLRRVGSVYSIPTSQPLVSFAFDVPNVALVSISVDSSLIWWNIRDKLPLFSARIPGEGVPSSIDCLDGGLMIGRKQGTILQLLPVMSNNVLSTVRFVNSNIRGDDYDMFGHIGYDARIQTLWITNSRRESIFALRVSYETGSSSSDSKTVGGSFEQVLEFPIAFPAIKFSILSAQATVDPLPEVEADSVPKTPLLPGAPGGPEMALVALVLHKAGVDQVVIDKKSFALEVIEAQAKLPGQIPDLRPGSPQRTQWYPARSATVSRLRSAESSHFDVDPKASKEEAPKPSLELKGKPKNKKEKGKDVNARRALVRVGDITDNEADDSASTVHSDHSDRPALSKVEPSPPILRVDGKVPVNSDGGFCLIFRGYVDTRVVAMKTPKVYDGQFEKRNKWIMREANLWRQVQHLHILEFLGIFEEGKIYVISPWCSNGNCLEYMKNNADFDKLRLLIQTADAVLYLHTFLPVIVHGDIKAENISIDDHGNALLCDFGLSRLEDRPIGATITATELASAGTYPFMAPELFAIEDDDEDGSDEDGQENNGGLGKEYGDGLKTDRKWSKTIKSDVYAFGCLIIQVVTGNRPYSNVRDPMKIVLAVTNGRQLKRPQSFEDDRLWSLSSECRAYDANSRPSIKNVLTSLRRFHFGTRCE